MSQVKVVRGLPPTYKRQRKDYTLANVTMYAEHLPAVHGAALMAVTLAPDLSYKALAASLKIPVGTLKSRLNRGRARLAKLLEESEGITNALS